ncbi:MAG: GNAT family N-acetyltransferase [Armatimonadetes bacterium]|nr:GNAT family N-acetyltransferase [Armatimonadota bacterium]
MAFGWEGEKVRLVPLDIEKHLANAVAWVNDPDITANLLIGDMPITELAEREYFEHASKETKTDIMFAIETLDGTHLGFSGLHRIDWRNGFATTGTFIGAKDLWGKGYGTDAAKTRARYAFEVLGLRMLYSEYLEGNERSRRMQLAAGYKECGRLPKKYWKRGQYRDLIQTYLDRETWEAQSRA